MCSNSIRRLLVVLCTLTAWSAACSDNAETLSGSSGGDTGGDAGSPQGTPDTASNATPDAAPEAFADAAEGSPDAAGGGGNTNVNLSGAGDFGHVRRLLDDGIVPDPEVLEADGFFAEHHTPLPEPDCGDRVCLQGLLGVMGNLLDGSNCTLLQLGLNSPIVAEPGTRPPLTLAVVVDVSGSMSDQGKLDFVRDGLELLFDSLRDDDQVALITYETLVETPFPMQFVELRRNELRGLARGLIAEGATNLHDGLQAGYREVLQHYDSGRQNRVILLSDGQPTSGVTETDDILAMSRTFNGDGIGLTTVGLGTAFNVQLMRGLAQQADGNFYFLENSAAVDEVFTEEISYFTVPVAFDLELEVRAGSDYEFGRAYGSAFWEDTDEGGRLDVPSVFLAHRVSHDDVTSGGGRRGGGSALLIELMPAIGQGNNPDDATGSSDVAIIDVRFREPGTNAVITDQVVVTYPEPAWKLLPSGHFEAPDPFVIQKSFVMLNIYVGFEAACRIFHMGEPLEALQLLERLIAAVEDFNEELNDVDMAYDLELLEQLAAVIRANSPELTEPDEWDVPDDPWPAD